MSYLSRDFSRVPIAAVSPVSPVKLVKGFSRKRTTRDDGRPTLCGPGVKVSYVSVENHAKR